MIEFQPNIRVGNVWEVGTAPTNLISQSGLSGNFFYVDLTFSLGLSTFFPVDDFYLEATISSPDPITFYALQTYRYFIPTASLANLITYQPRYFLQVDTNSPVTINITVNSGTASEPILLREPQIIFSPAFL